MGRGDSQASEITALPAQHRQRGRRRTAQKQAGDRRSYADSLGSVANPWTQRSFELANAPGYLDRLHLIYPMQDNEERKLSEEDWAEIEAAPVGPAPTSA